RPRGERAHRGRPAHGTPQREDGSARVSRKKAIVLGASGYIGGEAVRLLLGHPHIDLVAVGAHDSAGLALVDLQPNLRGISDLVFKKNEELLAGADVFFLSLPHGE